jgi:hypothetical protein
LNNNNLLPVLHLADKYQLEELKDSCSIALSALMNDSNVVALLGYAHAYNLTTLVTKCNSMIVNEFQRLMKHNRIQLLQMEYELMEPIISHPDLNIQTETDLCLFISDWLKYQVDNNIISELDINKVLDHLLLSVRLPLQSKGQLLEFHTKLCNSTEVQHVWLRENRTYKELVQEAIDIQYPPKVNLSNLQHRRYLTRREF